MGKEIRRNEEKKRNTVVLGGGTGIYTVLSALKSFDGNLSAVVAMADDGGSTGILRDEFGVLPPGDLRQCLTALSEAPGIMRKLFTYRYERGSLKGHSFGNIFLSTLERITGSLEKAIEVVGEVLNIRGRVIPVTLDNVQLVAKLRDGKILKGESAIDAYQHGFSASMKHLLLTPRARLNPAAKRAFRTADVIIIGPGDLYTSLISNLLVSGCVEELRRTRAQKIFITNLMNKKGQTMHFRVADHVSVIEGILGKNFFDVILYNSQKPPKSLLKTYSREGDMVAAQEDPRLKGRKVIGMSLLSSRANIQHRADVVHRSLIRHDQKKLARALLALI